MGRSLRLFSFGVDTTEFELFLFTVIEFVVCELRWRFCFLFKY